MKILESNSEIENDIMKIILKRLYQELLSKAKIIKEKIKLKNIEIWQNSDAYKSLLTGDLNHELGFPKGEAKGMVDRVLERVSESIDVIPKLARTSDGVKIMMQIHIFNKNIDPDILESAYIANEKQESNAGPFGGFGITVQLLPWLEWLTIRGNEYIIYDYVYVDKVSTRSRSGKGFMKHKDGGAWKVPAEFSGTEYENWLTRPLVNQQELLAKEYGRIINEVLNA
jgi:hypothetical protein